jgi:hypothetical protein
MFVPSGFGNHSWANVSFQFVYFRSFMDRLYSLYILSLLPAGFVDGCSYGVVDVEFVTSRGIDVISYCHISKNYIKAHIVTTMEVASRHQIIQKSYYIISKRRDKYWPKRNKNWEPNRSPYPVSRCNNPRSNRESNPINYYIVMKITILLPSTGSSEVIFCNILFLKLDTVSMTRSFVLQTEINENPAVTYKM